MRLFRYENVRGLQPDGADPLVERFRALDVEGRRLTVLRLRLEHAASDAVTAAWLEQCGRNRALSVQGLLPLRDFGMYEGGAYASLERVEEAIALAMLLRLLHARGDSVSPMLAVHIALELCVTLARAHQLTMDGARTPLFHGDLCAERVLVHPDGRLLMSELGLWLALPPDRAFALRTASGPAEHLAPELARGGPMDALSDLFGLGVLIRRLMAPPAVQLQGSGTRRIAVSPSRELTDVLRTLVAEARGERASSVAEARSALAALPRHTAGAAALAQLHADVQGALPHAVVQSAPRSGGSRTALFVAPARGGSTPAELAVPGATAPIGDSGFRGRTQIMGLMPLKDAAAAQPTTRDTAPPRVKPARADRATLSVARGSTARISVEVPALLSLDAAPTRAASEPLPRSHDLHATAPVPALLPGASHAGKSAPSATLGELAMGDFLRPSVAPRSGPHPGSLTLSSELAMTSHAPELADRAERSGADSESLDWHKPRERWRDASDTVFRPKPRAGAASASAGETASPKVLFVLALVIAMLTIMAVGLLLRLVL